MEVMSKPLISRHVLIVSYNVSLGEAAQMVACHYNYLTPSIQ
jgi:hypothetical protein